MCYGVLLQAFLDKEYDLVTEILDSGVYDLEESDDLNNTPLLLACIQNKTDLAIRLIEVGANGSVENVFEESPLTWALNEEKPQLISTLIKFGVKYHEYNLGWYSLLEWALHKDHEKLALELVKLEGIEVNNFDMDENTPLMWACDNKRKKLACEFINRGANVNAQNKYGHTPLMFTCHNNNYEMAMTLIKAGANINTRNKYGRTAIFWTRYKDQLSLALKLIELGAYTNIRDDENNTPLIWACEFLNQKLALKILEHEVDVNVMDKMNYTALYNICSGTEPFPEIVSKLLEMGADPNIRTIRGLSPLDLACRNNHKQIIAKLIMHGAIPNNDCDLFYNNFVIDNKSFIESIKWTTQNHKEWGVKYRQHIVYTLMVLNKMLPYDIIELVLSKTIGN